MSKKATRASIYARISNDLPGDELGVARQIEDCQRRADREGFTVVEVYTDNDISASVASRKPRPAYDHMMADARAGRFEVILSYSNSRLTRRPKEFEGIIEHHSQYGTRFLTIVSGDDDLSTADGRMVARFKAAADAGEADRTAERARRKQKQLAEDGRHNGPRPFGWDIFGEKKDQRLIINAAEAAVLRECVKRVLAGEGIWKIVNDLNQRGIKTSTGRDWQTQVLRRVMLRSCNYGMRSHQPLGEDGKAKGKVQLYPGQWEPIIDREMHDRVVAHLTNPARRSNNRGTEARYLLTSVALCGECKQHVVGTNEFTYTLKSGRVRVYPHSYKCPHAGCMKVQRRMEDVDEHVTRVVLALLERDGVRLLGGDPIAAESARERIAELDAKMKIAADRFVSGEWTDEMVSRITAQVRPQLEAERAKLRKAQPDSSLAEWADSDADRLAAKWATASVDAKKGIIRLLGMRITINQVGSGKGREYDPASVSITREGENSTESASEASSG